MASRVNSTAPWSSVVDSGTRQDRDREGSAPSLAEPSTKLGADPQLNLGPFVWSILLESGRCHSELRPTVNSYLRCAVDLNPTVGATQVREKRLSGLGLFVELLRDVRSDPTLHAPHRPADVPTIGLDPLTATARANAVDPRRAKTLGKPHLARGAKQGCRAYGLPSELHAEVYMVLVGDHQSRGSAEEIRCSSSPLRNHRVSLPQRVSIR